MPYIGPSPGTVEYGRLPAVGSACVLTVQSSPDVGAVITVTPADIAGDGNGTTNFNRSYDLGTVVTLTAPGTHLGNIFQHWTLDAVVQAGNPIDVTMDADHVVVAVYAAPCALTVQSTPDVGAGITVTPNDLNGNGNGTTNFGRSYAPGEIVSLTAPATLLGNDFLNWTVDGIVEPGNPIDVTMDVDHTAIAVYLPPGPAIVEQGVEMLKVLIPKFKYWKSAPAGETSYPNLEDGAEGKPIPEAYGILKNITPVCVDTTTGKYKTARRAIKAIDEVRDSDRVLVVGTDYSEDLANAEFTLLTTPLLTGGATYYFILESDYAINGADYYKFARDSHGHYGHSWFEIDGAGAWTEKAGFNMEFIIYGRTSPSGSDRALVTAWDWTGWSAVIFLRDAPSRTRIAQEFVMPAGGPYYLSYMKIWSGVVGSPSSAAISKAQIVSAYNPAEIPVGMKSDRMEDHNKRPRWVMREGGSSEIRCDIQGHKNLDTTLMENVSDVLQDIYVNVLGGTAAGINAANLATLKASRTQDVARYMSEEKEFQQSLEIFEAGHLFKFLPSLDGDFAVRCLVSGEPAGTPHLKIQHIKNFTMRRVWSNVFQVAKVKYYQDPSTGDWLVAEEKSNIASCLYNRQDSIEVETTLKDAANATQLAEDYLGTDGGSTRKVNLQYPTRLAEFDVLAGYGDQLIPTMKVKLTLPRADYAGGVLAGVLFRVLEVTKNPMNGESHVLATLDSLTY
jgi:hypothetical protein